MANLEKLDNAIKELEIQSNELKDINKVFSEIGKLENGISDNMTLLKENNDGLSTISKEVKTRLEESTKQLDNLESTLVIKIQELYQDNKNFQKELDASLTTRLKKHKSDIQVEIRNEGTQIQKGFETSLSSHFNSMIKFMAIGIGIGLAFGLYLK